MGSNVVRILTEGDGRKFIRCISYGKHELKLRVETAAAVLRCVVILPAWLRETLSEQLKFDSYQGFCEIEKEKRSI